MATISRDEVIKRLCILTQLVKRKLELEFGCTCGEDRVGDNHLEVFDELVIQFMEIAVFEKLERKAIINAVLEQSKREGGENGNSKVGK